MPYRRDHLTSYRDSMPRQAENEAITQQEIAHLKKRRDALLNTACNRFERPAILEEVRRINERLRILHVQLGRTPSTNQPTKSRSG